MPVPPKKRAAWRRVVCLILAYQFCIQLGLFPSVALAYNGKLADNLVPEIYIPDNVQGYCSIRFDINHKEIANRKETMLYLIKMLYDESHSWGKYVVVGADYTQFHNINVIFSRSCADAKTDVADLQETVKNKCDNGRNNDCLGGISLSKGQDSSDYVGVPSKKSDYPIYEFVHYRGGEFLKGCTIRVKLKSENHLPLIIKNLYDLRIIYRMPYMDYFSVDGYVYILQSRDCDNKEGIFAIARELLVHNGFNPDTYFDPPEFNPDISRYRFAEVGLNPDNTSASRGN